MLYQTIALLSLGAPSPLVPEKSVAKAQAETGETMSCRVVGDPHVTTFEGVHCNLNGIGLFTSVNMPGVTIQSYYCPPPATKWGGKVMASFIAGTAMKIGSDTVTMVNETLIINGQTIDVGYGERHEATMGSLNVSMFKSQEGVGKSKLKIESGVHDISLGIKHSDKSFIGAYHDLVYKIPKTEYKGMCSNTCAMMTNGKVASVIRQNGKPLFSQAQMALLESECGVGQDLYVSCSDEVSALTACAAHGYSFDTAKDHCMSKCPTASEVTLEDCIFDVCEMRSTAFEPDCGSDTD